MKNRPIYTLILLLSFLTYGCNQKVCPPEQDPETEKFRNFVMSLDGKYKIRSLWIDGKDSSALLDSLHIRNEVFYTKDYDRYDQYCCTECPLIERYNYNKKCTGGRIFYTPTIYIAYSFLIKTVNKQPGLLEVSIGANKLEQKADLSFFISKTYDKAYFQEVNFSFGFLNNMITLSTIFENHEIKLVIS